MLFLQNFGFPSFVTIVLLYDKLKSNGSLRRSVDNNTKALNQLIEKLEHGRANKSR